MIITKDHTPEIIVRFDSSRNFLYVERAATQTTYTVASSDPAKNRFGNETGLTWKEEAERGNIRVTEYGQLYTEEG